MAYFEFPHTRTYDSDLGWLIHAFKEISAKLDEYLENAVITFADPITWDITNQYTALTCVIDSDGTAYLSKQPVPAGVPLSDTDYWLPIFNYDDNINELRDQIAYNARNSATTGVALQTGDLVFWDGLIYKVLVDMPAGTAFIDGTNVTQYTVDQKINDVAAPIPGLVSDVSALQGDMTTAQGDITTLQGAMTAAAADILALQGDVADLKYCSILLYGGVEDGVTDNTAAFNACMAAHGCVYFPPHTGLGYVLSDVTLTDNQNVIGDNTKIIYKGTTFLFTLTGSNITVSRLYIEFDNYGRCFSFAGAAHMERIYISHIFTVNCGGFVTDAAAGANNTLIYFDHCTCRRQRGAGFFLQHATSFLYLVNCTIDNIGTGLTPTWKCYDIRNNAGCHLSHCEAEGGYTDGTHPGQGGYVFYDSVAIWIDNCFADYQDGSGFYFDNASYIYMTNSGASLVGGYGIFIKGDYTMLSNIYIGTQSSPAYLVGLRYESGVNHSASNVTFNAPIALQAGASSPAAIVSGGSLMSGVLNAATPLYYRDILSNSTLLTNIP